MSRKSRGSARPSRTSDPGRRDLLFVNAGIADPDVPAGQVSAQTFTEVMITNALAPMHAIEILKPLMKPGATIGVMSSRQGGIGFNTRGGHEVYRASKSALNQLMRSSQPVPATPSRCCCSARDGSRRRSAAPALNSPSMTARDMLLT